MAQVIQSLRKQFDEGFQALQISDFLCSSETQFIHPFRETITEPTPLTICLKMNRRLALDQLTNTSIPKQSVERQRNFYLFIRFSQCPIDGNIGCKFPVNLRTCAIANFMLDSEMWILSPDSSALYSTIMIDISSLSTQE